MTGIPARAAGWRRPRKLGMARLASFVACVAAEWGRRARGAEVISIVPARQIRGALSQSQTEATSRARWSAVHVARFPQQASGEGANDGEQRISVEKCQCARGRGISGAN